MYITKREFAESIVYEFLIEEEKLNDKDIDIQRDFKPDMILKSSSLAVAAEYLGLLDSDPEMLQYAQTRAGTQKLIYHKNKNGLIIPTKLLTTIQVLECLPEKIEEECEEVGE
jgi:hypothetical protein